MATTYEPIQTLISTSNQTTFNFSSIPATYTDLRLVFNYYGSSGNASTYPFFRYNGSSGNVYAYRRWYQSGQQGVDSDTSFSPALGVVSISTQANSMLLDIFSYSTNGIKKTSLMTFNQVQDGGGWKVYNVILYDETSPITSLSIGEQFGNGFGAGTTVTLYGIKAA